MNDQLYTQLNQLQLILEDVLVHSAVPPHDNVCEKLDSPALIYAYMRPRLAYLHQEQLWVLNLTTRMTLHSARMLYQGTVNGVVIRNAELFRDAIQHNLPSIIIVHNHPSGDPAPSKEDMAATLRFVEAGRLLDIEVVDHIIVGADRFYSLRQEKHF
jgi:DNA repair protein RadC